MLVSGERDGKEKPLPYLVIRGKGQMDRSTYIRQNVETFHNNTTTSRYQESGLSEEKAKLNHAGFNKLMDQRGISEEARNDLRNSFTKGSEMQVRHAHAGEQFITTHGVERNSGVFVSEQSLGNTPGERIDKGALPHTNSAEFETSVVLGKDQNLIYGEIAAQSKFSKMDPEQLPRNGGAIQVITDGGYQSGAVINHDAKFPAVVSDQNAEVEVQNNASQLENNNVTVGGVEEVTTVSDFDESFLDADQGENDTQEMDNALETNVDSEGIGNE